MVPDAVPVEASTAVLPARPAGAQLASRLQVTSVLLSLSAGLLLGACGGSATGVYPVDEGWEWVYEASRSNAAQRRITVVNQAARQLEGRRVIPQRIQIDNLPGYNEVEFVISDETGVGVFGVQRPGDLEPSVHGGPQYHFRYPLRRGATWTDSIVPVFMFPHIISAEGRTEIVATDDDVTVAAGTFGDCMTLKTTGMGTARDIDAVATFEEHRWYCRGVGLVRMVRHEKSNSPSLPGGTRDLYLVSFRRP